MLGVSAISRRLFAAFVLYNLLLSSGFSIQWLTSWNNLKNSGISASRADGQDASAAFGVLSASTGATTYGLHMDLTWRGHADVRAAAISRAQYIGAKVSRNSLLWHLIEPQQGSRNWAVTDAVVNELATAGIENVFAIYGSPSWANGVSGVTDAYLYVPTDSAAFSLWTSRYKAFVTDLVNRYKSKVKKWELWNEPNEHYFWKPAPNINLYVAWYQEMYQAIKAADPTAQVAVGGLAGLAAAGPKDYNGNQFLTELYKRGIFPDAVSIHPYGGDPSVTKQWDNNFTDIQLIYNTMLSYGQGSKPVWVTEWGWPTNLISETVQADWVQKSLEMIRDKYPFVTIATYFVDYDRPPTYYHGLYTSDYRMKPSAQRFKNFTDSLPKSTVSVSVSPSTVTLAPSKQVAFSATVSGTTNTSVTWSLSSPVGTISTSGLYTAPSSVSSTQTVTVIATSVAQSTARGYATVTIEPGVSVSIQPTSVSLGQGQTQQFTASVSGTTNTGVTWSLSSPIGTVSTTGLYTAPSSISSTTTLTIRATSVADTTKSASASITLNPPSSSTTTPSGVTAWWKMNEGSGTTAADSSGYNNTATLRNGAYWGPGKYGNAVVLDGVDDHLRVNDSPSLRSNSFTITTWFRASNVSGIRPILSKPTGGGTDNSYILMLHSGALAFHTSSGGGWTKASTTLQTGVWYHAAVVKSSTSVVLYLNGTAVGTSNSAPSTVAFNSQPLFIGAEDDNGDGIPDYRFAGSIDDVRFFNRGLTQTEIQTVMASEGTSTSAVSVAVQPTSVSLGPSQSQQFTASVSGTTNTGVTWSLSSPIGTVSTTGLYTAPSTISSTTSLTIRATSVADTSKSATATITLNPPPSSPPPSSGSDTIGTGGPAAWWTMNEGSGTTAADSSGNGNTATLRNGAYWGPGKYGNAVVLDGVDDHLRVNDSPSLRSNSFTITTWFRASNVSGIRPIFSKPTGGGTDNSYILMLHSGALAFHTSSGGGWIKASTTLQTGVWYHAAVVKSGTSAVLYLNGTAVGTSNSAPSTVAFNSQPLFIGAEDDNGDGIPDYRFAGSIDDVRFYNRTLTASELSAVMTGETTTSSSTTTGVSVTGVSFDPTVRRYGHGDNWALTWAADGNQYTALGDGYGFDSVYTNTNVNRVIGDASAPSFQELGPYYEPRNTWYGYGLIQIGTRMYHSIGRLVQGPPRFEGSKLVYSDDSGKTWYRHNGVNDETDKYTVSSSTMMFWNEPNWTMSQLSFLQAGQANRCAKDNYVYVYSPNGHSDMEGLVLARVPQDKINLRSAYEFFVSRDSSGNATWSSDITRRGFVHRFPSGWVAYDFKYSWHPTVVYNPGLRLYMMMAAGTGKNGGAMFSNPSGLGIYTAPNPWGPWTEVHFNSNWVGDNSGNRLYQPVIAPKWISSDGKVIHLVYSDARDNYTTNYKFNLQKVSLAISGSTTPDPCAIY